MERIRVEKSAVRQVENVVSDMKISMGNQFDEMEKLYWELMQDETFKSEALKGFLEVMEITLQYQSNIMPLIADYLLAYTKYYDELSRLSEVGCYKEIS